MQSGEFPSKICIFDYLLVRDHMIIERLEGPETVDHMVPIIFLQAQRGIVQGQGHQFRTATQVLKILDLPDRVVMEMKKL